MPSFRIDPYKGWTADQLKKECRRLAQAYMKQHWEIERLRAAIDAFSKAVSMPEGPSLAVELSNEEIDELLSCMDYALNYYPISGADEKKSRALMDKLRAAQQNRDKKP